MLSIQQHICRPRQELRVQKHQNRLKFGEIEIEIACFIAIINNIIIKYLVLILIVKFAF